MSVNEHMNCCSGLSCWHRIEWLPKKWRHNTTTWPIRVAKKVVLRSLNWKNYLLHMGLRCCHRNGDRTHTPHWYALHRKLCWEIWAEWVTVRDESSSMLLLRWSWAKDILVPLSLRQDAHLSGKTGQPTNTRWKKPSLKTNEDAGVTGRIVTERFQNVCRRRPEHISAATEP